MQSQKRIQSDITRRYIWSMLCLNQQLILKFKFCLQLLLKNQKTWQKWVYSLAWKLSLALRGGCSLGRARWSVGCPLSRKAGFIHPWVLEYHSTTRASPPQNIWLFNMETVETKQTIGQANTFSLACVRKNVFNWFKLRY